MGSGKQSFPVPGKKIMKAKLALVFITLLLCPVLSHAQGLGSIIGTLTDATGAAVASCESDCDRNRDRFIA
jgi:hypothetical protein